MHLDPPILIIGGVIAVILVVAFIAEKGDGVSPRIVRDPPPDTPDKYDVKAAQIHGTRIGADPRDDNEPMEVVVVGLRLSIDDVFRLSLQFIVVQIIFGLIAVLALSVIGVI